MTSSTETGIGYDRGKCTPDYLWSMNTNCMFNWLARCPLEVKNVTPFVIIYNRDYFNLRIVFFIRGHQTNILFRVQNHFTIVPTKMSPNFCPCFNLYKGLFFSPKGNDIILVGKSYDPLTLLLWYWEQVLQDVQDLYREWNK